MLDAFFPAVVAMSARFENIDESDEIRFDVGVGIFHAVSNARLRREIDDDGEGIVRKEIVDKRLVGDISEYETP